MAPESLIFKMSWNKVRIERGLRGSRARGVFRLGEEELR
jgi:hypothetical protein